MRPRIFAALLLVPAFVAAQVPRAADGKPDLTGVWQGGSTRRGSWEEANSGNGVGGTGKDAKAPAALASTSRPPGREPPPYKPEAAKKVLESYNNRALDDPTAFCLPPGIPRNTLVGLFPYADHPDPEADHHALRIHECLPRDSTERQASR